MITESDCNVFTCIYACEIFTNKPIKSLITYQICPTFVSDVMQSKVCVEISLLFVQIITNIGANEYC